jgi:AcrR family transcriptional regulator
MGIPERKEREFQRREQEILDAALMLFKRDDWQAVTIDEIAQSAEIGKGTVYKHFPSKEDIYARLALDFNRRLLERLRAIDPGLDVLERLKAVIAAFWEFHIQSQDHHRLVQYCRREDFRQNISEETREVIRALDDEFNVLVTSMVREGIDTGLFPREKSTELLLFGAQAALFGAIQLVWSGCLRVGDPDEYLEEITDFIIAGLTHSKSGMVRPSKPAPRAFLTPDMGDAVRE